MADDKYLKRLDDLKKSSEESEKAKKQIEETQEARQRYKEFKEGYKKEPEHPTIVNPVRDATNSYLKTLERKGDKIYHIDREVAVSPKEKGEILNTASTLMSMAQRINDIGDAVQSAKLYELLGVGNRASVKRRLLKVYEKNPGPYYLKEVKDFLKRNPGEKEGRGLEKKFIPVIAGFSLIVSLFFLSSNITGNAIGNLTKNGSNIIGLILLIIGLIGLLVYFKKK